MHEPAVLQRFTRFNLRLDGSLETTCERRPIYLARMWCVGGSRGGYTCMSVLTASRPERQN